VPPRSLLTVLALLLAAACGFPVAGDESPAGIPAASPPPATAETTEAASAPAGRVTINAVGDVMLARDLVDLMDRYGPLYPYERVRHLLADADVTIANLEGTFTEHGAAASKLYTFRTPPRHARGLAEAGIDIVSLGNNHTMDYGREGLEDTLAALDGAGVRRAGAGLDEAAARRPAVLEAGGLRLAFLSYNAVLEATFAGPGSPGVARASVAAVRDDVAAARAAADLVIVALHAGSEYTDAPTAEQRALARAAIDAGAALVLGHHAHVLQGWERYGGGLIVYGLGNFVFDLDADDLATLGPRPFLTIVLRVELGREGVIAASARPVFIDPMENRPLPATGDRLREVEERLQRLSAALSP
jgi:poly-gamma-glutamate synthesis protein (capsule biosynthesis protein)